MDSVVKRDLEIYLSCDARRLEETRAQLLAYLPEMILRVIYLPKDSEKRFRVYDLCIILGDSFKPILENVFKECRDDSDPLAQLAAIEFVREHKLSAPELFVELLSKHGDDPLLLPTIALASIPSLIAKPVEYKETLNKLIVRAVTDTPDLLGILPDIARTDAGAQMLADTPEFVEWASEMQHDPEIRTMNVYIRTLMVMHLKDPIPFILTPHDILQSLNNPAVGLRVACLDHVSAAADLKRDEFLTYSGFVSAMCDVTMDTTVYEENSRLKAQDALGISIQKAGANAPTELRKEPILEQMVI